MVCRWGMPGLIFSKLLNVSPVWQNEEAVGPVDGTERLHINSTGFWSWQLLYRAASVVVDIFRTVCKDHLQERCLSIKSFYVISSDCTISLLPPVLGKTLPHAPPSQIDKSLGPKGMRDTWKSSSAEPLIEIVGHSLYLLDPEISDFICVLVVTVPMRFPLSLEAGGGRRLKAIVSESSLHFPRQNNFHFSCVSCKGNVFRYVAYQMWVYKQGKVGERNCYLELAAFLVRWSRKYKPSPCLPPGFCSGHCSDLPEKVSCCKIAFKKLASLSKK